MKVALLSILFLSLNAFALNSTNCPLQIEMESQVTKVYKTSRYSQIPGWKEAQKGLIDNPVWKSDFRLFNKSSTACQYTDFNGNRATLSTASFQDPDSSSPTRQDQFTVNYNVNESNYVTFIPVKSYNQGGLVTYRSPVELKVKVRLQTTVPNRPSVFDLGMISVVVQ